MVLAVVLVVAAGAYAAKDVHDQLTRPSVQSGSAAPSSVSTADPRRQVRVTVSVTSDAPFGLTYVDAEGEEVTETSADGREISLDLVGRGDGPHLQVWAQTAPQGSFVRCRIALDSEEAADERVDGPAATTYCVA